MKLVIHPPVEDAILAQIRDAAGDMEVVNAPNEGAATEAITDAEAFYGKITPGMLAAAGQLQWVQTTTASLEHYMFDELVEHPCTLTNMRGLYSDVIADHVFGYVLCFARNLHIYLRQQWDSKWAPVGGELGRSTFAAGPRTVSPMDRAHMHISDCTLGVIGLGNIGSEIARRGLAFGMRILAVDPQQVEAPEGVASLWRMDRLGELLAQSDFVVVAAPHTPETEKMIRRETFQQMQRTAYFINIGRGAIVVLDGLVAALDAGEIAGAALDVFEVEPLPAEHPLWKKENVILTPHVAACTVRLAERHIATLLDNISRFVRGERLQNIASKAMWF